MKSHRQEKILELINQYEIETQDDLIRYLQESGFDVTQATIWRDIRELKLTKVLTGHGSYRYVLPTQPDGLQLAKYNRTVIESIISAECAGNIFVIKTYPGLAQAVALGIDNMNLPKILGTVGGDDTIISVTKDAEYAKEAVRKIHEMMRSL
jgi:transcriptional regulator of arginine metabolism